MLFIAEYWRETALQRYVVNFVLFPDAAIRLA